VTQALNWTEIKYTIWNNDMMHSQRKTQLSWQGKLEIYFIRVTAVSLLNVMQAYMFWKRERFCYFYSEIIVDLANIHWDQLMPRTTEPRSVSWLSVSGENSQP
jgi:hypothetical protein